MSKSKSPLSSHVIDTALGTPARGLAVRLDVLEPSGDWKSVAHSTTNEDGRVPDLMQEGSLEARTYRLTFETGAYHAQSGRPCFYPRVEVIFSVDDPAAHYHVPLLLSPFGYSTYRGS